MSHEAPPPVAVLAVDGGNSKTELVLVGPDGRLLAAVRGPTTSHQVVGMAAGADGLARLADQARRAAGLDALTGAGTRATVASCTVAGADSAGDVRRLERAYRSAGLAEEIRVVNDAFAPVRAGTDRGWGVGVICGAGVNAAGIAPDGRTARLAALGNTSGDWGGGTDVGIAGLGAAVRARDGRGPRTSLERLVPAHFGLKRPLDLTIAFETDRIHWTRVRELSPVVFGAARDGDVVARAIIDRLADEVATMAIAIVRRLHLTRRDVDVTLAGGVFRADDADFEARIAAGIHAVAPLARIHRLDPPPVLGAALLGLDRLRETGAITDAAHDAASVQLRRDLGPEAIARD
jgi:N-acetylglucosamine kinase-like BadF-type ATPase